MAGDAEIVTFPSEDEARTAITGYIYKPDGQGPFPAIVALHGCGGLFGRQEQKLNGRHREWGERLRNAGYIAFFPDSYTARGLKSVCELEDRKITPNGRVADVKGAVDWLASQSFADPKKFALIGWSNGGSTVLRAMAPNAAPAKGDFKTAFSFYPGCASLLEKTSWKPRLNLTILIGDADDWTPAAPCRELSKRWGSKIKTYPGAYHAFDAPNTPVRVRTGVAYSGNGSGQVHVGTDAAARSDSIDLVMRSLETTFRKEPLR